MEILARIPKNPADGLILSVQLEGGKVEEFPTGIILEPHEFDAKTQSVSSMKLFHKDYQEQIDRRKFDIECAINMLYEHEDMVVRDSVREYLQGGAVTNQEGGFVGDIVGVYSDWVAEFFPGFEDQLHSLAEFLYNFERFYNVKMTRKSFDEPMFRNLVQYGLVIEGLTEQELDDMLGYFEEYLKDGLDIVGYDFLEEFPFYQYTPMAKEEAFVFSEELIAIRSADIPQNMLGVRARFLLHCNAGISNSDINKTRGAINVYMKIPEHLRANRTLHSMLRVEEMALLPFAGKLPQLDQFIYEIKLKALFRHLDMDREVEVDVTTTKRVYRMDYALYDIADNDLAKNTWALNLLTRGLSVVETSEILGIQEFNALRPIIEAYKSLRTRMLSGMDDSQISW